MAERVSRERELLALILSYAENKYLTVYDFEMINQIEETFKNIKELLAQHEQEPKFNFDLERMKAAIESPISDVTVDNLAKQVKQEPVAWKVIDGTNGEYMFSRVKPMERNYKFDVVIPLYTAPPKREPLSDEEIYSIGNKYAFHAAVREIERIHGIGGGNE